MAFYCGDCVTWINSEDANRYGEKYCDYDRKYRAKNQNIYGCRGFVWARRAIITKVCEILEIDPEELFSAFDEVKEEYLVLDNMDRLVEYNFVTPMICEYLDTADNKENIAKNLLEMYIIKAEAYVKMKKYQEAVLKYTEMVNMLTLLANINKENIHQERKMKQLIRVHK